MPRSCGCINHVISSTVNFAFASAGGWPSHESCTISTFVHLTYLAPVATVTASRHRLLLLHPRRPTATALTTAALATELRPTARRRGPALAAALCGSGAASQEGGEALFGSGNLGHRCARRRGQSAPRPEGGCPASAAVVDSHSARVETTAATVAEAAAAEPEASAAAATARLARWPGEPPGVASVSDLRRPGGRNGRRRLAPARGTLGD